MTDNDNNTLTDNYRNTFLERLNDEQAVNLLPVTIYLLMLIILGLIGNSVTIHIYNNKFKKTPSKYFIIWLAVLDLLSCFLTMPLDIIDLTRPYLFDSPGSCKTLRFIQYATVLAPGLTIVVIAIDRHDKVFRPFKRMSNSKAKLINCVTLGISVVLAVPVLFIFGRNTVPTTLGINGVTCDIDDFARGEAYTPVYYSILFLVFALSFVLLAIFYGRLWWKIRSRSVGMKTTTFPSRTSKDREPESHALEETSTSMTLAPDKKHYFKNSTIEPKTSNTPKVTLQDPDTNNCPSITPRHSVKVYGAAGKTTKIFFVVSLVFAISFLPQLIARIVQVTMGDVEDFASVGVEVMYYIATRLFFINNAINPIIYLCLNPAFRKETKKLFKKCSCGNNG